MSRKSRRWRIFRQGNISADIITDQNSIDQLIQEAARRNLPVDDCVITPNIVDQCCEGHPDNYITGLEVRILSQ